MTINWVGLSAPHTSAVLALACSMAQPVAVHKTRLWPPCVESPAALDLESSPLPVPFISSKCLCRLVVTNAKHTLFPKLMWGLLRSSASLAKGLMPSPLLLFCGAGHLAGAPVGFDCFCHVGLVHSARVGCALQLAAALPLIQCVPHSWLVALDLHVPVLDPWMLQLSSIS